MSSSQRRLDLHLEIGKFLGPIVQRETTIDAARVTDIIDVLVTHTCEIMATYYGLSHEDAIHCYHQMRAPVQAFISQAIGEKDDV